MDAVTNITSHQNQLQHILFRNVTATMSNFVNRLLTLNLGGNYYSMSNSWLRIVLFNFFIAASMGLLLRLAHIVEIPWMDFKHMMHAHSHTAMLGWLFMLLYGLILDRFTTPGESSRKIHRVLFWAAQVCVVGMMFSFPVQGYGPVSITFTTAHLLVAYIISVTLLQNIRGAGKNSVKLMRTALLFMVISTIGVWLIGPIKAGLFGNSVMYYASIQFFLHFQFNGWFTFAVLAFVFQQIEQSGRTVSRKEFRWFYGLLIISLVLTYALSVAWSTPEGWLFWVNGIGVLVQLAALILFLRIILNHSEVFLKKGRTLLNALYIIALVSFTGKILIQTAVVVPQVAVISYTIRQFVVGFIHLTMLGSITCYFLATLTENGQLHTKQPTTRYGLTLLTLGLVLSEVLLFLQGISLWMARGFLPGYYESVFAVSALLPAGILLLLTGSYITQKRNDPHQNLSLN